MLQDNSGQNTEKVQDNRVISLDTGYTHVLSNDEACKLAALIESMEALLCEACEEPCDEYEFRECGRCPDCCDEKHSGRCGG